MDRGGSVDSSVVYTVSGPTCDLVVPSNGAVREKVMSGLRCDNCFRQPMKSVYLKFDSSVNTSVRQNWRNRPYNPNANADYILVGFPSSRSKYQEICFFRRPCRLIYKTSQWCEVPANVLQFTGPCFPPGRGLLAVKQVRSPCGAATTARCGPLILSKITLVQPRRQ